MAVRRAVMKAGLLLGLGMTGLLLASCATGPDPQVARRAQSEMIGMPEGQLLACAGVPARRATAGGRDYFTYVERPAVVTGPGTSVGIGGFGGSSSGFGLGMGFGLPVGSLGAGTGCEATFVISGGVVEQVSYPANAELSACTPIVQNCIPPGPR